MTSIMNFLSNLNIADLVAIHNVFCYRNNCITDLVFPMSELDDLVGMETPSEVLKRVHLGDFNIEDAYAYEDDNRHLFSFTEKDDNNCQKLIDIRAITLYIIDNDDWLGNIELMQFLVKEGRLV